MGFSGIYDGTNTGKKAKLSYKYALFEGEVNPTAFPTYSDAKNFENWKTYFENADQWKTKVNWEQENPTATKFFSRGENYGEIETPFVATVASLAEGSVTIKVSDLDITVNVPSGGYTDLQWDSKTGIVSVAGQNGTRLSIPYYGSNPIGGIQPDNYKPTMISITEKGTSSDTTTEYCTVQNRAWKIHPGHTDTDIVPMTLKYHYWYY